jgi:L-lysine exporter family protein LysE/ArgO
MIFGVLGVAFLGYYGFLKLKEEPKIEIEGSLSTSLAPLGLVVGQTLAFTLLNPHVYLDAWVLIGGYSSQFPEMTERSLFGAGASTCSFLWFFGLAYSASRMSRYMNNSKVMRGISLVSGVVLITLACKLGSDVLGWYLSS